MNSANWNTSVADIVCQNLGYPSSTLLEAVPKPEGYSGKEYYSLLSSHPVKFEKSSNDCDQFVSLRCDHFGNLFDLYNLLDILIFAVLQNVVEVHLT